MTALVKKENHACMLNETQMATNDLKFKGFCSLLRTHIERTHPSCRKRFVKKKLFGFEYVRVL